MQTGDRSWGKAFIGKRVGQTGPYGKDIKINLLLAISGDDITWYRWIEYWTVEGTTGVQMINFIQRIINSIGPGNVHVDTALLWTILRKYIEHTFYGHILCVIFLQLSIFSLDPIIMSK